MTSDADPAVKRTTAETILRVALVLAAAMAVIALAALALRAALRFDPSWDGLAYHLPFAAQHTGIDLPYETSERFQHFYEGFPPLPDFLQGVFWRLTGSVHGTGVVNYLAFVGFLAYSHIALRARFALVTLIALTAPLVIIHAATSYIDLFSSSFLAAAASSCLSMVLFPERTSRVIVIGGLVGAAGTAWSKIQLAPLAALFLVLVTVLAFRRRSQLGVTRRRLIVVPLVAALIAAAPYIKNLVVYGNPLWPLRVPVIGNALPYALDPVAEGLNMQTPLTLKHAPQIEVFARSLFETENDPDDDTQPRWVIDQWRSRSTRDPSYRLGGYWGPSVAFYLVAMLALFVLHDRRRGIVAGAGSLVILVIVGCLPQSHELRYYMFLPLTWAAGIGMTFPSLSRRAPWAAAGLLVAVMALFGYMVGENRNAYAIERLDLEDAAHAYDADRIWPQLHAGPTYCAVLVEPLGILLTGPTLSEFRVVERKRIRDCPEGTIVIGKYQWPPSKRIIAAQEAYFAGRFDDAIRDARKVLAVLPDDPVAWLTICGATSRLERWAEAADACQHASTHDGLPTWVRTNRSRATSALQPTAP